MCMVSYILRTACLLNFDDAEAQRCARINYRTRDSVVIAQLSSALTTMRMATQKMFRGLVALSLVLNVCCIGWFMLNGQQGANGTARTGRDAGMHVSARYIIL